MAKSIVFTDGGCNGNPGSGWAYIVTNLSKELFLIADAKRQPTINGINCSY